MKCLRCKSERVIKFIDGFGNHRIFCKNCKGSFLENYGNLLHQQKRLNEFNLIFYDNPRAIKL